MKFSMQLLLQRSSFNEFSLPSRGTYSIALFLFFLFSTPAFSQSQTKINVSGTVRDSSGIGIPQVTVSENGTNNRTSTGSDGNFTIGVSKKQAVLTFSSIGYAAQQVAIGNQTNLTVSLHQSNATLGEVVVVGYGTQKRADVTAAIATVKSENFVKGAVTDAAQLIRGKVAGLNIITTNADPTGTSEINLRGITTLRASSSPLVLIDGVPGTLTTVAPGDIDQIDVLKDGSAAAIYGTRGTNGVILITTRQVRGETPPTIDVNTYVSTQRIAKTLDFMNASQYRQLVAQGIPGATDYGTDVNWLDQVLQRPASEVYNISLKGGNRNTTYIASLEYRNLNGIMRKSNNKVFFPRLSVNHSMFDGKIKINANVSGYQQQYFAGNNGTSYRGDVYRNAYTYNPTDSIKKSNGVWTERPEKTDYANPVALLEETDGLNQNSDVRTYGTVTYLPVKDINIKMLASHDVYNSVRGYYETKKHYSTIHDSRNGFASRGTTRSQEDLLELTAQYNKTFKSHQITALGGYSWRKNNYQDYWMQNWDFPTDEFSYNNMGAGLALKRGQAPENTYQNESKLLGYFFRLNYNFKDKYLLMASIRHEGSSKFGANYKYGNFPAVSIGWNLKREAFLENAAALSTLKLRAGYGITGTEPSDPYISLSRLNFNTYTLINGQWIQAVNPSSNPNPNLRWEKKEELNLGLDYAFINNRISGSIDLYKRTTKDLLFDYPVPTPPYLYNSITANAASMENKGIEVQLNIVPVRTKNFEWSSSVNYSTNKNRIVSLSDKSFQLASGYFNAGETGEPIQQPLSRVQIGQPIGNFYGFKSVDIDENGHWIIEGKDGKPKPISQQQADDRQIIGNGLPKHYANWNNTITYKNFDLNVTMRGAFGFQILNTSRMYYSAPVMLTRGNVLTTAFDKVYGKRPLAPDQELQYVSYFVEKGDYWKIDNLTLGYNLTVRNKYIKRVRLYTSASNLYTMTSYTGVDPEVSISGLTPGVDYRNRYPSTRTFTLGTFLTF